MKTIVILLAFMCSLPSILHAQSQHALKIKDLGFTLDEKPFHYTGISFFNAIYNPTFNKDDDSRNTWLKKLKDHGINVIRVWGQWDNTRGFVDTCPTCTLYESNGDLRTEHLNTLKKIIEAADEQEMVVLFVLFQRESWNENIRLSDDASNKAVKTLAEALKPYRNLVFQIWNEFDHLPMQIIATRGMRRKKIKRCIFLWASQDSGIARRISDKARWIRVFDDLHIVYSAMVKLIPDLENEVAI